MRMREESWARSPRKGLSGRDTLRPDWHGDNRKPCFFLCLRAFSVEKRDGGCEHKTNDARTAAAYCFRRGVRRRCAHRRQREIGRASCRERVEMWGGEGL